VRTEGLQEKAVFPRKNWMDIIGKAEELATDRAGWRQRVAECRHQVLI